MYKSLVVVVLLMVTTLVTCAQTAIEKGDAFFNAFQYKEAIKEYEAALKTERTFKNEAHLLTNLAYSYTYTFQYSNAEQAFLQLVKLGDKKAKPDIYLDYGSILKILGKYDKAKEQFAYYNTLIPKDDYANFLQRSLNWAIQNQQQVQPKVVLVGTNLEIAGQSLGYCLFKNGLIYSAPKEGALDEFTTLYELRFAERVDSITFQPSSSYFNEINFPFNEASPSLSADKTTLYFTAVASKLKQNGVSQSTKITSASNFRVYKASLVNDEFAQLEELPFNTKEANFLHPFMSADGKTIFFASDMPGGYGGLDIYRCIKLPDGNWSTPMNLGDRVNSVEHDAYPFIQNNTLYFASKGHNGFGGYDVFSTTIGSNFTLAMPQNLGKPYNSSKDDMAYIMHESGTWGYISSNRESDNGEDKIYYYTNNYIPMPAKANVLAMADSVTIKPKSVSNEAAKLKLPVTNASAKQVTSSSSDINMQLVPKRAYFDFNSAILVDLSMFDDVVSNWKLNQRLTIEVKAFADCRGSATYNMSLSAKRGALVVNYLKQKGVAVDKIRLINLGENQPLENCSPCETCTEDQLAKNRRVEVRLK